MMYLLDTNACIQFLNPRHTAVSGHLAAVSREDVAICQIVKAELYYGAYKSARREANLACSRSSSVNLYLCLSTMPPPKPMAACAPSWPAAARPSGQTI
jgi:hypothetical protein